MRLSGILLALLTAGLCACATPAPTGSFAVGRTARVWVDPSRPEAMTPAADDHRETPVIFWYPAEARTGSKAAYFPGLRQVSKTLAASGEVSSFEVAGLHIVGSHNRLDARLAQSREPFPVIVLSPGNGTNVEFYDSFAADLASHGYVVVGINHPFDVAGVMLAEGRAAQFSEGPLDATSRGGWIRDRMAARTGDILFVIETMAHLGGDPFPAGRLDLSRIGVMGHSLGGVGAAQTCYASDRIGACLNLDGIQGGGPFGLVQVTAPPKQPFMFITKEQRLAPALTERLARSPTSAYLVVVPGATHDAFSDSRVLRPTGPGAHKRAVEIVTLTRSYVLAFFDKALKGLDSPLLAKSVKDEKVRVDVFSAH
jgi:dienelactone hydrolase